MLQRATENNRTLARQNARLLEQLDRLKAENELVAHELGTRAAAFRAREAEGAKEAGHLQQALHEAGLRIKELTNQLHEAQARGWALGGALCF